MNSQYNSLKRDLTPAYVRRIRRVGLPNQISRRELKQNTVDFSDAYPIHGLFFSDVSKNKTYEMLCLFHYTLLVFLRGEHGTMPFYYLEIFFI